MDNINYYLENKLKYKRAVPLVVSILMTKVGQENAMKLADILDAVRKKLWDFNSRSLRFAIHEIRVKHLVPGLVANNYGFYVETEPANLLKYLTRLDGYIKSMTAAKKAIIKDMLYLNTHKKKVSTWKRRKPNTK
jgi:hypothetical protein